MNLVRLSPALIGAALLLSSPAIAQTPAAPSTTSKATATRIATTKTTTKTNAPVARTAKSLDCSKQADTKKVHGKARKTFMSSCKKA